MERGIVNECGYCWRRALERNGTSFGRNLVACWRHVLHGWGFRIAGLVCRRSLVRVEGRLEAEGWGLCWCVLVASELGPRLQGAGKSIVERKKIHPVG